MRRLSASSETTRARHDPCMDTSAPISAPSRALLLTRPVACDDPRRLPRRRRRSVDARLVDARRPRPRDRGRGDVGDHRSSSPRSDVNSAASPAPPWHSTPRGASLLAGPRPRLLEFRRGSRMRATGSEGEGRTRRRSSPSSPRFVIEHVAPTIDGGRYPIKRILGEACPVEVDILRDGHDVLAGRIVFRGPGESTGVMRRSTYDYGRDRWRGSFVPDRARPLDATPIEAWTDRFATWRHALLTRLDAGRDVAARSARRGRTASRGRDARDGDARATLARVAENLGCAELAVAERAALAAPRRPRRPRARASAAARPHPPRARAHGHRRSRARPLRRAGTRCFRARRAPSPADRGTFRDAAARLPGDRGARLRRRLPAADPSRSAARIARARTTRRRRARTTPAAHGRSAAPRAATPPIEPELGTLADFDHFVAAARRARPRGRARLRAALLARPSRGSASTPIGSCTGPTARSNARRTRPTRSTTSCPLDFWCDRSRGAVERAAATSSCSGSRTACATFRVDNPHTKPFAFWEWVIADDHSATTPTCSSSPRPSRARSACARSPRSASASRTRTSSGGRRPPSCREYLTELTAAELAESCGRHSSQRRPTSCTRTCRPAAAPPSASDSLLAATLSPLYGIYSGYELCEDDAAASGQRGVSRLGEVPAPCTATGPHPAT